MTQKERQERSREMIYQASAAGIWHLRIRRCEYGRDLRQTRHFQGMMYHYFSRKDDLFLLCVDRTFRDLQAYIEETASGQGGRKYTGGAAEVFYDPGGLFPASPQTEAGIWKTPCSGLPGI